MIDTNSIAFHAARAVMGTENQLQDDTLRRAIEMYLDKVEPVQQRRSMDSASKKENILLFFPNFGWVRGQWESDRYANKPKPYWTHDAVGYMGIRRTRENQPTAWMPLPDAPKEIQP